MFRKGLSLSLVATAALIAGCASGIKKVEIPSTASPSEEISQLETDINAGYNSQYDVLAEDSFAKARKYLDKAKSDMNRGKKQETILEDVGYARAYLNRTRDIGEGRRGQIPTILEAREAALSAGVKNSSKLESQFKKVDDDVRDNAKDFPAYLEPKDVARLQADYLDLERLAIQDKEIGNATAAINGAIRDGAKKNTPKLLRQAETDLETAAHVISANRHNPAGYTAAVQKANYSAKLLTDVLAVSKRPGRPIDEAAALRLVQQNRELASLKGQLGTAQDTVSEMSENLRDKTKKLEGAVARLNIQQALEEARTQFKKDEAEVYQEGDKLLIRLKAMNFPSGKADLPEASLALLSKVKNVAKDLGPSEVIVEGHTDSTGNAALNQELSQERAQAVAKYLESNGLDSDRVDAVGYGYKKPIASNKSKAGRAQNRRVDIVITPARSSASDDAETPKASTN
jgi:outer membrane protein OmpA-like peptidoglycan-associated protein